MIKLESPLRLPNGKKRESKKIVKEIFPDGIKELRDINCTAGNISFEARNNIPDVKIWMNTIDSDIVNFFKYASYYNDDIIKYINKWKDEYYGKDLFDFVRTVIREEKSKVIDTHYVKLAAAFFILNRLSFSGTMNGGFTKFNYKNRFTESSIERLRKIKGFITHNWQLTSLFYQPIIEAESKFRDSEVLIYANVPYFHPHLQMYKNSENCGNLFDYERLALSLSQTPYKFLVTVDDSNYMRSIFGFANIISKSTLDGKNKIKSNKVVEKDLLYITNY